MWVYAGGGEAEVGGFVPFLQRHLRCTFERRTPRPKPGPRPGVIIYSGNTGRSFTKEIRDDLLRYWDGSAQAILVLDDADIEDPTSRIAAIEAAVTEALAAKGSAPAVPAPEISIALAVPELEIWLLADWENTFKMAFGNCHSAVRHTLSTEWGVDFSHPENFRVIDADGQYRKISVIIQEVIRLKCETNPKYSKATDTPRLLLQSNPAAISRKCPYFRRFWNGMRNLCSPSR